MFNCGSCEPVSSRRPLHLAAGSMLDVDPMTLAEAAAAAGFDGIGLRLSNDHALDAAGIDALRRRLDDLGLSVHDVEVFRITEMLGATPAGPDELARLIDGASALGARSVLVVSDITGDDGLHATEDALGAVARRCAAAGLTAAIEYMAWTTPNRSCDAIKLAESTGAVVVADLLHHHRLGEGAAELRALAACGHLGWVQLCDAQFAGPFDPTNAGRGVDDLIDEARHHRLPPGTGTVPLADLLAALDGTVDGGPASDAAISVEVQSDDLAGRLTAAQRAALLYATAVSVLGR